MKVMPGYRTFRCLTCKRRFHERTGTPFNDLRAPVAIVFLVVRWRLRCKLGLRDRAEMFPERGFVFSHETVRTWEALVAPVLTEHLRARRRGNAGVTWHADETYVKIHGVRCYRYRAIDADGKLVDSLLSAHRDREKDAITRCAASAALAGPRASVWSTPRPVNISGTAAG
jgi:DDE superfamily endonuclease